MKKLLFVLAVVAACLLSCRSVKNVGLIQEHHHNIRADTIASISKSETVDSTYYYRAVIDSLCSKLREVRQMFHNLYVKDSIARLQYRDDKEKVKDTTWIERNPDGSITYHNYREKYIYSYQQVESVRNHVTRESQATIDSLIERNERQRAIIDSMSRYQSYADSVSMYRSRLDSMSNIVSSMQEKIIYKNSLLDRLKMLSESILLCVAVLAGLFLYLRFVRRHKPPSD